MKTRVNWLNLSALSLVAACFVASIALVPGRVPEPQQAPGAADVTLTGNDAPFYLLDVATGSAKKVILPKNYKVTIAHTALKSDGSASGTSDYVVLMQQADTMAANTNAGKKALLFPNGFATILGENVTAGADGSYEIQLQAVTGSAKIQFAMVPLEKGK